MNRVDRIRILNDLGRKLIGLGGGAICKVCITPGIQALGPQALPQIFEAVSTFNDFHAGNDPHGEHDCAMFEVGGNTLLWKIDYFDRRMEYGSDDPSDPMQTTRVLTIMLACEY